MKNSHEIAAIEEFLRFLRSKFTMIHNSSFFFRDLHYGVMGWFASQGKKISYPAAESTARQVAGSLVERGIFKPIDDRTWMVNYPEFALPKVEKKAPQSSPASPAPGASPAKPAPAAAAQATAQPGA